MATFTMSMTDTNDNDLGKSMKSILTDVQMCEEITLNKAAKIIKVRVEGNLRAIQKTWKNKDGSDKKRPREVHMADDVVVRTGKDKYGYRYAKIQGGKQTGTLWHIVNDGTYRSRATHFIDKSISEADKDIQEAIDTPLKERFEHD